MEAEALLIVAAVSAAVTIIGCGLVRIVPAGHRGVVIRSGRVVRSRPSGLLVVVPVVERAEMVSLHARAIDPLGVTALSRDGVELRLVVSVLWRATDPSVVAQAVPDTRTAVADAVERALRHLVAKVDLGDLLRDREPFLGRLPATVIPQMTALGAELLDVDLLDVEVRVGPNLVQLLA